MRILCVDDNRDAATVMAMLLKANGSEAITAHDGLAAVAAAEEFRPDVVLLDLGLPGIDGYEVARRIREQPWANEVVLVALTGWDREEDKLRLKEANFNFHMVKPVEHPAIEKLLAELSSNVT
jgi:CheY-like chemotaxis protein